MASRSEDMIAEKAYAEASAAVPVKAKELTVPVKAKGAAAKTKTAKVAAPAAVKVAAKKVAKPATVKSSTPPKKSAPVAATAATSFAKKGQTMITETAQKFTAEATKFAEDAKARTETVVADLTVRAKAAAEKGQEVAKDTVEFSKGNVEALVEAGKIAAKGLEAMGQEAVAFTKAQVEETTAAAKRYAAVKSPTEFFQLHTELTKAALDTMVKQGSKTTELTVKLANDAFQPISNRIALAVSKLKSAA
jgi:phasin family protein